MFESARFDADHAHDVLRQLVKAGETREHEVLHGGGKLLRGMTQQLGQEERVAFGRFKKADR